MPRRKNKEADLLIEQLVNGMQLDAEELVKEHIEEWLVTVNEAESKCGVFTVSFRLDRSESEAILTTASTFSEVHKDKRVRNFDDPKQGNLPGIAPDPVHPDSKPRERKRKLSGKEAASGEKTSAE